ncbi:MAG: ribosome assembly cofactor RimP [Omnitrophica WOR_2 bacterium]|jgi:ribosome maturation factor RimP
MIQAEELKKTVEEYLHDTDIFVVDIKVKAGNNITILLDSDSNIKIDDCVKVTRFIESTYNREQEDYSLTVSSAGVGQPLKMLRQINKNLGKEIEIEYLDKSLIKGTLLAADSDKITIKTVTKVKKEVIEQDHEVPFTSIKGVREVISFK